MIRFAIAGTLIAIAAVIGCIVGDHHRTLWEAQIDAQTEADQ